MKKHIILVLALVLSSGPLLAQSSHMTDDQVMSFVVKEHERGTSNSQIVTKLMQQGVDISRFVVYATSLRRCRNRTNSTAHQQQEMLRTRECEPTMVNKEKITRTRIMRNCLQPIVTIASRASRTTATIHLMMKIILTMLTSARR